MQVEVTETVQARSPADPYWSFLDWPKPGRYGPELDLLGWVLPASGEVERIELRAGDRLIAQTDLNLARPDLVKGFPDFPNVDQCGFRKVVTLEEVPESGELEVTAVLHGGERVPIGVIRLRRVELEPEEPPARARRWRTSQRQAMEERLRSIEHKVDALKSPIVTGGGMNTLMPPVGVIGDFMTGAESVDHLRKAQNDHLPLPHGQNREGYSLNDHVRYWTTGLEDYEKVIDSLGSIAVAGGRLYDFGGSTGRVFRHFHCQTDDFEIWTSDFKLASYRWNQLYMPQDVRSFLNTFYPPLPIPDRYFDVITAFSVFTHIDELESPWLVELRRILKPGGLLYVTIHDEAFWDEMPDSVLAALQRSPSGSHLRHESPFPGERSAFHFTEQSHYSCNVFHSRNYIQREWGRFFDVLKVTPHAHSKQCVVLLTYSEAV